jgi:hypothetical protein
MNANDKKCHNISLVTREHIGWPETVKLYLRVKNKRKQSEKMRNIIGLVLQQKD